VRFEIQLPTALVGYVRIQLGRGEVGVPEHFLNRSQVCSSLEKVRRKRVAEQVRVDPARVEPCFCGQFAEDQEGARPRERAASGVQKQLGAVPHVQEWAATRQVPPKRLRGLAADWHDTLFPALAGHADEPAVEIDARLL